MRRILLAVLAGMCFAGFLAVSAVQGQEVRPHILYILADDLGWKDMGFQGSPDIKTPNLDRLAGDGVQLDQFYVQPFCTPSRAALMTGRYPFRYGLQTIVIPSQGTYGLSTEERTLPEILKAAGYRTEMIGKWHLGHADRKYWPRQRGFDYHYGAVLGEIDYFTREAHHVLDWQRNNEEVKEEGYNTQLIGADAVRRIGQHDPQTPLFMYLAFTAAHTPYQALPEYLEKFGHIEEETRRTYAAMIACFDDELGKVLDALEARGMRQNTLIIFHSDNGGTRDAAMTGESKVKVVPCDNGTLRAGKGSLYEGGVRVPAIVNWPGRLQPAKIGELIHVVDMLPTIAGVASATTEGTKPLDGINVWPAIAEGKPSGRTEIIHNVDPFGGAVRQGEWKLVWKAVLPARLELFNIAADPDEKHNVAEANPQVVARLRARIEEMVAQSEKPLFMSAAMDAVFKGIFGPAPIPTDEPGATTEP